MAVLLEGEALALSSRFCTGKSVVYVKLTDSALKSLEESVRQKGSEFRACPTIQLRNSDGVIVVPGIGNSKPERFGFTISNLEDAGSFHCLQSTSHGSLDSMGTIRETVRVKANDDVYQRIIQKQQDAKRESEKKTTVLLESKDKKKVALPKSSIVKKTSIVNPTLSRHYKSAISSSGPSFSGPGRGGGQARPSGPRPPSPDHAFSRQSELKKCHTFTSSKPSSNSEISKRPIRERLIHLLAVKPYKKLELLPRLHKDGMKEKDKKIWMNILREVSELKNNCFELKRSVWNDVMEDWPFYAEGDKAALRRRKPQNLTPPVSDTGSTSSGHSPSSTTPASPPQITNPLKRQSYYDASNESKKKRVSHFKRTGPMSGSPYGMSGSSPMIGTGISPGLDHISPKSNMDRLDLPNTFEDDSAPDWGQFHDNDQLVRNSPERKSSPAVQRRSPMVSVPDAAGHRYNSPKSQLARTNSPSTRGPWADAENLDLSSSSADPQLNIQFHFQNSNKDFLTSYGPITSAEQRTQYKKDFNTHYNTYIQFHQILDRVRSRFTELENRLKGAVKGSPEYSGIRSAIVMEYEKFKTDEEYQAARMNFQYLHEKLACLKKLVHDYDTAQQR